MEVVHYDGGAVLVTVMPGDGHCLFSSLICQYHRTSCDAPGHLPRVWDLRRMVVDYIRQHLQEYWYSLLDTVQLINVRGQSEAERVEAFLQRLETTAEWGGHETISAAAVIYCRQIEVFCEHGSILTFNDSARVNGVIRIAYRVAGRIGRHHIRNHYDSVSHRLRSTAPPLLSTPEFSNLVFFQV